MDRVEIESLPEWMTNSQVQRNLDQGKTQKTWEKRTGSPIRISNYPPDKRKNEFQEKGDMNSPPIEIIQPISSEGLLK